MSENISKKIALLGQPNSGKSSIFNGLTGLHQHVGNWPGKTVEKKIGTFSHNNITYEVADLPGSYSLSANSDEEIVTRDYISKNDLDLVCILADASQLERSLYMLADFAGIKTPAMLVLTMIDVAESQGKKINIESLKKKLNIPVCSIVAPDKKTYSDFFATLEESVKSPKTIDDSSLYDFFENGEMKAEFIAQKKAVEDLIKNGSVKKSRRSENWISGKLLEKDEDVLKEFSAVKQAESATSDGALYASNCKFKWIESILKESVVKTKKDSELLSKFDRKAISPVLGKVIALGILLLGLVGAMIVAAPIMGVGGAFTGLVNPFLSSVLPTLGVSQAVIHFIESTLITALGWVISMVGFVFSMNFIFGIIEEVGYMARVSYLFDRTMSRIGLQGKAIMPLIIGFGCTIGSVSGTRVIDSWGQRILTMAVAWAVPCGATFVVIPTLANAFFGTVGGILVMLLIFAIMFLHIVITAAIFGRKLNPKEERTGMIMELPPYHKPRWGFIFKQALCKMWDVFKKAFSIELIVCVIFYFLCYSKTGIDGSILYKIGIFISPVTKIFGMGWQTFMSFIAAMISKEATLGVLSAIFANSGDIFNSTTGAAGAVGNIGELAAQVIRIPEALAFIIAVTFNVPCLQAVVATHNETHSIRWTITIALYYFVTALILAGIIYHIANLFM